MERRIGKRPLDSRSFRHRQPVCRVAPRTPESGRHHADERRRLGDGSNGGVVRRLDRDTFPTGPDRRRRSAVVCRFGAVVMPADRRAGSAAADGARLGSIRAVSAGAGFFVARVVGTRAGTVAGALRAGRADACRLRAGAGDGDGKLRDRTGLGRRGRLELCCTAAAGAPLSVRRPVAAVRERLPRRGDVRRGRFRVVVSPERFDRLWSDFRRQFGLVWSQRIRDSFNETARKSGWPVLLAPAGFLANPGEGTRHFGDERTLGEMEHCLRWLLRRFVDPEWIDRRLHPATAGSARNARESRSEPPGLR
jgi:hypothetical protein